MPDSAQKKKKRKKGKLDGEIDKAKDAFMSWPFSTMYSRFSLGSGVRSLG